MLPGTELTMLSGVLRGSANCQAGRHVRIPGEYSATLRANDRECCSSTRREQRRNRRRDSGADEQGNNRFSAGSTQSCTLG